jgi:hypothetical protein
MKVGDLVRVPPTWANSFSTKPSTPALVTNIESIDDMCDELAVCVMYPCGIDETWYDWQLEIISESH